MRSLADVCVRVCVCINTETFRGTECVCVCVLGKVLILGPANGSSAGQNGPYFPFFSGDRVLMGVPTIWLVPRDYHPNTLLPDGRYTYVRTYIFPSFLIFVFFPGRFA
jgi:hypothetical protein